MRGGLQEEGGGDLVFLGLGLHEVDRLDAQVLLVVLHVVLVGPLVGDDGVLEGYHVTLLHEVVDAVALGFSRNPAFKLDELACVLALGVLEVIAQGKRDKYLLGTV